MNYSKIHHTAVVLLSLSFILYVAIKCSEEIQPKPSHYFDNVKDARLYLRKCKGTKVISSTPDDQGFYKAYCIREKKDG